MTQTQPTAIAAAPEGPRTESRTHTVPAPAGSRLTLGDIDASTRQARIELVDAVRDLTLAAALTTVGANELAGLRSTIERVTDALGGAATTRIPRPAFHEVGEWARSGRPMPAHLLNPALPDMLIHFGGDYAAFDRTGDPAGLSASARLTANSLHEGPPDSVHGGVTAFVVDVMTSLLVQATGLPAVTGTLTVRYPARTPLDRELHLTSRITERQGRRVTVECTIAHEDTVTIEGTGLFVVLEDAPVRRPTEVR